MDYVRLDEVHKRYERRYGAPTLHLHQGRRKGNEVDEALKGCTLRVSGGESVAVLGPRNAGCSTLISVIAGLYRPDSGTVLVRGRATGLVAMGAGFASALPVQSCVSLNAAILGMSKQQLEESMGEILAFSGLDAAALKFPLREISGAKKRLLAYGIAVRSKPDVMLADGTVVVGKGDVAERCLVELGRLRDAGHALVIATNDKDFMSRLCERAIVLDDGQIVFDGSPNKARRLLKSLRRR